MEFEWDERKRISNLAKHGVDFRDAVRLDFSIEVSFADERRDYGEVRRIALVPLDGRVHVLVDVVRLFDRRVISLCRANAKEIKRYEAQVEISDARGGRSDQSGDCERS